MMNQIRNFLILTLPVLLLAACGKHEADLPEKVRIELPAVSAKAVEAVVQKSPTQVEVSGVVRATDRAILAPKVMGTISELPVKLGQRVIKGDLLVKINAAEIGAKVSQAQTQLKQAQRDLDREQRLLEKEASTSEIVRNLEDQVAMMESMVTEAEVMLGYTDIRAPISGSISRIYADEGSLATPGNPLLELEGTGGFEIEANVPESLAAGQVVGARYQATLPSGNAVFEVIVTEVSSGFDNQSRSVKVRFAVPPEVDARVGQFARITVEGAERSKILVPAEALSKLGQMERIFVLEDGHARLRLVKTGAKFGDLVEVISGLDAGEMVVINAAQPLLDGQPLEVIR